MHATLIFQKIKKNSILGSIWVIFAQIWVKNEFFWKKGFWKFLNILIIYYGAKICKNYPPIPDKNPELLMDRKTDRQRTVIF